MTATVLIVDDSTFIVEGLVALLRKSYRTLPSYGGEECLVILRNEHPDVIVLDIMMEPMDGWETLARIKDNPATRHIPVLMFSAKKLSPDEAEAHRFRIDDFLTKPVNPRELVTAIEKILEREEQKKKILYRWAKAGIPQEKTDEFITISSNLDVDTSLLAAMQKQMDHPTTLPVRREELAVSISMLQERIEEGHAAIEKFLHETGQDLPSPTDDREPDVPAPVDVPSGIMTVPASDAGTLTPVQPAIEESLPRGTGFHEEEKTADGGAEEPAPASGSIMSGPEPDPAPPPVDVASVPGDESSGRVEPALVPASPEPAPEPSAGIPYNDTLSTVPPPPPEPVGMMVPGTDRIGWIPANPPAGPDPAGESPGTGHLFKPAAVPAAPAGKKPPAGDADTPVYLERGTKPLHDARPSRGFLSGIIAVITGFFSRGRK